MSIRSAVLAGVKVADKVTKSLQSDILHYVRTGSGQDVFGNPSYAAPVTRRAVVELGRKMLRNDDGQMVEIVARVLFISQVSITPKDKLVLPGGLTGPIVNMTGVVDAVTEETFYKEIWIGP